MTELEVQTKIAASPETCFDLARDIGLHTASLAHTGERVTVRPGRRLLEPGDEVKFAGLTSVGPVDDKRSLEMKMICRLALFSALVLCSTIALASETGQLSVEFSLTPSAAAEGAFDASTVVRDIETDKVVARHRVAFPRGEKTLSESRLADGRRIQVVILVPETGDEAEYSAILIHDGKSRILHRATVRLGSGD